MRVPGIFIGNCKSSYWTQAKVLEYTSRSGNQFIETKSGLGLNAKIFTTAAFFDNSHYIRKAVADFGAVTSGYIEARVYVNPSLTPNYVFGTADEAGTTKYFYIGLSSGKPVIRVYNASPAISNSVDADAALSTGWHTIRYESVGGKYKITVDGTALTVGAGLTMSTGSDNGKWVGDVLNRDNITFGYVRRSGDVKGQGFYCDYVNFNNSYKWVFGRNGDVFDIIGGYHLPWSTTVQFVWDLNAGRHFIDVGFTVWYKSGSSDILVPYASAGVPIDATTYMAGYAGFAKDQDYPGYTDGITYAYPSPPCLIGFNETGSADSRLEIFDRSNTTRQEDISRSSTWYDSTSLATKCRYHGSEILHVGVIESLFKAGYKHRIFPVNDNATPTKIIGFVTTKIDLT